MAVLTKHGSAFQESTINVWGAFSSPIAARQRGDKAHLPKAPKAAISRASLGTTALASRPVPIQGPALVPIPITSCSSERLATGWLSPLIQDLSPLAKIEKLASRGGCARKRPPTNLKCLLRQQAS